MEPSRHYTAPNFSSGMGSLKDLTIGPEMRDIGASSFWPDLTERDQKTLNLGASCIGKLLQMCFGEHEVGGEGRFESAVTRLADECVQTLLQGEEAIHLGPVDHSTDLSLPQISNFNHMVAATIHDLALRLAERNRLITTYRNSPESCHSAIRTSLKRDFPTNELTDLPVTFSPVAVTFQLPRTLFIKVSVDASACYLLGASTIFVRAGYDPNRPRFQRHESMHAINSLILENVPKQWCCLQSVKQLESTIITAQNGAETELSRYVQGAWRDILLEMQDEMLAAAAGLCATPRSPISFDVDSLRNCVRTYLSSQ